MGGIYLTELASWLRTGGLNVVEYPDWQYRSRSSGGYDNYPLCVMWHHTASPKSWDGQRDADYLAVGDDACPVSNLYIDRSGTVWVIAGGATNTNGKGKSLSFSRGTVPADSMNTRALGVEMGNDGVGEQWPERQVNAMFLVNNVCNSRFGNVPTDLSTHNYYAPDRKIDPATTNVAGPWKPASCNSSGTWSIDSVRSEASRRAGNPVPIPPQPQPPGDIDVEKYLVRDTDGYPWVTDFASYATSITEEQAADGVNMRGYVKGADNHPFPLSPSDTDLMHRLSER